MKSSSLSFLSLLLAVVFASLPSAVVGQEQYEIQIRTTFPECTNGACRMIEGRGNAVVFAANQQGLWALTAAHNVTNARSLWLIINGREVPAQVAQTTAVNIDTQADIAVVYAAGDHSGTATAVIEESALPESTEVEYSGYSPVIQNQQITGWAHARQRARITQNGTYYRTSLTSTVTGNSGGGYYCRGKLVAIHRGKIDGYGGGCSSPVIRSRLLQWGYRPATQGDPNTGLVVKEPTPAPASRPSQPTDLSDINARIARIESVVATLSVTINNSNANQSTAAMLSQLQEIRSDVDSLKPLTERRVILVSDGKVTSQRTLKPSDPIVLGSEIVVRKQADAGR